MTLFTALVCAFWVAVGLALSITVQNFAIGILVMLLKPFVDGKNRFHRIICSVQRCPQVADHIFPL